MQIKKYALKICSTLNKYVTLKLMFLPIIEAILTCVLTADVGGNRGS